MNTKDSILSSSKDNILSSSKDNILSSSKEQIRQYVAQNLLFSNNGFELGDDASFLEEGVVDSTGVLELVMFVEDTFGVAVADEEIVPDNFDSVNNLALYIHNKTAA